MEEEDYKPNSNRFKEEQKRVEDKKVEKIISSPVITRKRSGIKRIKDDFISEDAKNIKSFIFGDVLLPAMKKAIHDIFTEGIDIILYGESRGNRRSAADRVSYRSYYDSGYSNYGRYSTRQADRRPSMYEYDDIILNSRAEAEEVLDRLDELIAQYGLISVADLYDLVGISGDPTNNGYGWTSIRNAKVTRVREGYMIEMPKPMPID